MIQPRRVMKTREVAELFGVSGGTLSAWIQKGWIKPSFRTIGGHARFYEDEVITLRDEMFDPRRDDDEGSDTSTHT